MSSTKNEAASLSYFVDSSYSQDLPQQIQNDVGSASSTILLEKPKTPPAVAVVGNTIENALDGGDAKAIFEVSGGQGTLNNKPTEMRQKRRISNFQIDIEGRKR